VVLLCVGGDGSHVIAGIVAREPIASPSRLSTGAAGRVGYVTTATLPTANSKSRNVTPATIAANATVTTASGAALSKKWQ
jgi:hypothetical protein